MNFVLVVQYQYGQIGGQYEKMFCEDENNVCIVSSWDFVHAKNQ